MDIDPYLGIKWPLVLEVQFSNIIWILVDNINWILDDWCTCLSYRLKRNLVLPKYNISNSVLYDEYLFLYVSYEMYKIQLGFYYDHTGEIIQMGAILLWKELT